MANFTTVACRISSPLKWYKNYKNRLKLAKVIVKNKLPRFLWFTMYRCPHWTVILFTEVRYNFYWLGHITSPPQTCLHINYMPCHVSMMFCSTQLFANSSVFSIMVTKYATKIGRWKFRQWTLDIWLHHRQTINIHPSPLQASACNKTGISDKQLLVVKFSLGVLNTGYLYPLGQRKQIWNIRFVL